MAIKRQTKHKLSRGTGIVFCALIYAILFLPIVIVVANSFNGNTEKPYLSWGGFSLRWYVHLFQNGPLLASFGNTMLLAITTTVLATALGTLGAVGLYRYKFPGRNLIDSLLYIPGRYPRDRHGHLAAAGLRKGRCTPRHGGPDHRARHLLRELCDL